MLDTAVPSALGHIAGGPETLFRLGGVGGDFDRVTMTMRTGAWTRRADGRPARGSIGVLVDDMFALAVAARRPAGSWAVTTELTIDYCAPVPTDGSELHAESEAVSVDASGGLGRGTVRNDLGTIVALGTQRVRFVPSGPPEIAPNRWAYLEEANTSDKSMLDLLDAHFDASGALSLRTGAVHANPVGNLHGGILMAAAEAAAAHAVESPENPLETASIHVAYVRPGPTNVAVSFTPVVLHRGRSFAVTQVEARRTDGKTCGLARVLAHRIS